MDLALRGRVAPINCPAKGMGAAVPRAVAIEACRLALAAGIDPPVYGGWAML